MFSSILPQPPWQEKAVRRYLQRSNRLPAAGVFNASGRAYNDVAALGSNIPITLSGDTQITGGTSASGPIFAALVALWNDGLLAEGKPPVGFLNPFLYQAAERQPLAFRGVTSGDNTCTEPGFLFNSTSRAANGKPNCCKDGFFAETGTGEWNPLGGLGAVHWEELNAMLHRRG